MEIHPIKVGRHEYLSGGTPLSGSESTDSLLLSVVFSIWFTSTLSFVEEESSLDIFDHKNLEKLGLIGLKIFFYRVIS